MVTGGAGFIGSHVVDDLVRAGHRVVVYDNFSTGQRDNLQQVASDVEIIEADILDADKLLASMRGCDWVSHHAAQLEIFLSTSRPEDDLEQNTIGTLNVLRAARDAGVRKLVNVSSACVYGQTEEASREDGPCTPNWAYGVSKLAAEKYATIFNDYQGVPVASLRYAIVYGEREWYRRVLPIFLKRVLLGQPPVVFGDGTQVRDFIHVEDVVRLHRACLEDERAMGHVFNVGRGIAVSIRELAAEACAIAATPMQPQFEDTPEGEFSKLVPEKRRNTAELKRMLLDPRKAESLLGWKQVVPLREGLRLELQWAANHLSRWEKVRYSA
jgi:UDP-glucose 4-epimerase